ncbi:hypothetical protein GCM10010245_43650 [Streptomyces spectabilis]|nr:hypothetical protein GCM10010245_43650 [Streptomyces spectabilis]
MLYDVADELGDGEPGVIADALKPPVLEGPPNHFPCGADRVPRICGERQRPVMTSRRIGGISSRGCHA